MTATAKDFWNEAYQNNIGRLIAICYRYTRNRQLSEDLAHDAFLKAIDKYSTFEGKGKFEAWLLRIVVNHALQYLRDRKKDPFVNDLVAEIESGDSTEENTHPHHSMNFTIDEMIETIDQLPEHHRLVFNLYVMEEFTHAQIGEELGISEGTSKSHLARARKKLQQLLIRKAEANKDDKEHKKALVLLLAGAEDKNMDQLFRKSLDNFSIPPQKPLSLEAVQFNNQHWFSGNSIIKSNANILVTSVTLAAIVIAIVMVVSQVKKPEQNSTQIVKTIPHTVENKSAILPPPVATISKDSVIPERNIKQNQMKPLDSLALMLALSSVVPTATSKDSIKNQIEQYSRADTTMPVDSAIAKSQTDFVNSSLTVQKEKGSFRASELFWSEQDKELYFRGKVRVDFKRNHFQGNGEFTFIGKVQLLIVDGQAIGAGRTVKLADEDYDLVTLDSKEATAKYGNNGWNGAVEISRGR